MAESEMVEKVAEALFYMQRRKDIIKHPFDWEGAPEGTRNIYRVRARAAIEAMKDAALTAYKETTDGR